MAFVDSYKHPVPSRTGMSHGSNAGWDPDLVGLVQERGEQYWRDELQMAKTAVIVYAVVIVLAIGLRLGATDPYASGVIPYLLAAGATIYAGASQVRLLPFMDAKLVSHLIAVGLFALLGFFGPLWLLFFVSSNSKAKRNLEMMFVAAKELGESPRGVERERLVALPPRLGEVLSEEEMEKFSSFLHSVDTMLQEQGLPRTDSMYAPEALWHAYVNGMDAEWLYSTGGTFKSPLPTRYSRTQPE